MKRVVLGLAAILGWVAVYHYARAERPRRLVYGSNPDAFPFPTSALHEAITLDDEPHVRQWCESLDCTEEQLRAAVRRVGTSAQAVRSHISRRR